MLDHKFFVTKSDRNSTLLTLKEKINCSFAAVTEGCTKVRSFVSGSEARNAGSGDVVLAPEPKVVKKSVPKAGTFSLWTRDGRYVYCIAQNYGV